MGLAKADPIETFHLSFLKFILNVKTSTPNCFVYGELGVLPQSLQRRIRVIKLWLKIIKPGTPNSSFMVGVYNELLEINREDSTIVTWMSLVKELLFKIGFGHYWEQQCVFNENHFLSIFKQRIFDIYLQEWYADVDKT